MATRTIDRRQGKRNPSADRMGRTAARRLEQTYGIIHCRRVSLTNDCQPHYCYRVRRLFSLGIVALVLFGCGGHSHVTIINQPPPRQQNLQQPQRR